MSVSIVGPFQYRRLVVDGWEVPHIQCYERDNGRVEFVIDSRLGFEVGPADFDEVARLVATAYALGAGLSCFPNDETPGDDDEARTRFFAGVPFMMRPRRCVEITSFESEEAS